MGGVTVPGFLGRDGQVNEALDVWWAGSGWASWRDGGCAEIPEREAAPLMRREGTALSQDRVGGWPDPRAHFLRGQECPYQGWDWSQ